MNKWKPKEQPKNLKVIFLFKICLPILPNIHLYLFYILGEGEYKAAQTKGQAEGLKDSVTGTVKGIYI